MFRNNALPKELIEATRLTRAGRLLEATALIRRTLRDGRCAPTDVDDRVSAHCDDAIDATCSAVEDPVDAASVHRLPAPAASSSERPARITRPGDSTSQVPEFDRPEHDGAAGQFLDGSFANHIGTRPYKLYLPKGYVGQTLPLVVMLHGCTQSADDFAAGTRMNAIADEHPCLVLYPEQTHGANHSRCWNWFRRGDQGRDRGEPALIAGMTREVMQRHATDHSRVYVAGLSAGGAMAAVMATAYPDLFAAVGVHSGLACGSAHDVGSALAAMRGTQASARACSSGASAPTPAKPTIVFHGDHDKTVHPRNGQAVVSQSIDRDGHSRADATTERGQVPGGHAYTRTFYVDSSGRAVLEHWLVHGGGHAWFGGSPRGSYVDTKGPDAAREMMRFFHQSA